MEDFNLCPKIIFSVCILQLHTSYYINLMFDHKSQKIIVNDHFWQSVWSPQIQTFSKLQTNKQIVTQEKTLWICTSIFLNQRCLKTFFSFCSADLEKMSSLERIAFLQEKLQDIRNHYLSLKSEVASIDRRRKRMKKKERESKIIASNFS